MKRIAVAGGIGAGKSVVSRVLRVMGYAVYDSDSEARRLMDISDSIKSFIRKEIHHDAVTDDGIIDRSLLGEIVFADESSRLMLNSAVHAAVRDDFMRWCGTVHAPVVFVECAILCESGLLRCVDEVWEVTAPVGLRIERVCRRNSLSRELVLRRIESQKNEAEAMKDVRRKVIINDDITPLLPQIEQAIQ